jgi:hypothetical protein
MWVVLTNTSRGVYYGELKEDVVPGKLVVLHNARHCFTWTCFPEAKGVWGLAVKGPAEGSQVGPTLSRLFFTSEVQYAECTEEAVKNWNARDW